MTLPFLTRFSRYAPLILRVGLATVVLWFGAEQLTNASGCIAWVPEWTSVIGLSPEQVVYANGTFEVVTGILLLFGFFTPIVAFVLFLHVCLITIQIGLNPTGVRDFGITVALLSLALLTSKNNVNA